MYTETNDYQIALLSQDYMNIIKGKIQAFIQPV